MTVCCRRNSARWAGTRVRRAKMEQRGEEYIEIDLSRVLNAMWRKAWAIVLAMVLVGGAAFFYWKSS